VDRSFAWSRCIVPVSLAAFDLLYMTYLSYQSVYTLNNGSNFKWVKLRVVVKGRSVLIRAAGRCSLQFNNGDPSLRSTLATLLKERKDCVASRRRKNTKILYPRLVCVSCESIRHTFGSV
jgi:hypothetical protein